MKFVKMDRLLHMVIVLLNRRRVRAKELADLFGVSVRTVYRDMDTLCQAGIPLVTCQGINGGIGIMDGYRLDTTVMTDDEWASVMLALKSLSSSHAHPLTQAVLDKIKALVPAHRQEHFRIKSDSVLIDLSPWESDKRLEEKIALFRQAIESSRLVAFTYSSTKGETMRRRAEPHTLVLKWQNWYLYGYCLERQAFRLFKLSRMKETEVLAETFCRKDIQTDCLPWTKEWNESGRMVEIVMRFAPQLRAMAEDRFGIDQVSTNEQGDAIVRFAYPDDEWLYGFLLSFGPQAEVLEPAYIRDIIFCRAEKVASLYREHHAPKT